MLQSHGVTRKNPLGSPGKPPKTPPSTSAQANEPENEPAAYAPAPKPEGFSGRVVVLGVLFLASVGVVAYSLWPEDAASSEGEPASKSAPAVGSPPVAAAEPVPESASTAPSVEPVARQPEANAAPPQTPSVASPSGEVSPMYQYRGEATFGSLASFLDSATPPRIILVSRPPKEMADLLNAQSKAMRSLMIQVTGGPAPTSSLPALELPAATENQQGRMSAVTYRRYTEMVASLQSNMTLQQADTMIDGMREDLARMRKRVEDNPSGDPRLVNSEELTVEWLLRALARVEAHRRLLLRHGAAVSADHGKDALAAAQKAWQEYVSRDSATLDAWVAENVLASQQIQSGQAYSLDGLRGEVMLQLRLKSGAWVYVGPEQTMYSWPRLEDLKLVVERTRQVTTAQVR